MGSVEKSARSQGTEDDGTLFTAATGLVADYRHSGNDAYGVAGSRIVRRPL